MNTELHALWSSAHAHALAGRYLEAIPDYQAALRLDPETANAHFDLHLAYIYTGQLLSAFQELDQAARLSNGSHIYTRWPFLYDMLALKDNLPQLQELLSRLPNDAKARQVLLGLRSSRQKNYPQALTHFENALREQPDAPYIQGYVGRTLTDLGRYAEAREVLVAVARDKRARSTELYNLAVAERRLRNYAAAVPALKRALEIDKNYFKALTLLAKTEYNLGHWRSAWFYFRQAVKQCPSQETLQMMTENK